jgi:hypothetical protein
MCFDAFELSMIDTGKSGVASTLLELHACNNVVSAALD